VGYRLRLALFIGLIAGPAGVRVGENRNCAAIDDGTPPHEQLLSALRYEKDYKDISGACERYQELS
jgi:hypothetical protein